MTLGRHQIEAITSFQNLRPKSLTHFAPVGVAPIPTAHYPLFLMKPPRSKLRGITRKSIVCETPRFLTLFPLQGNLGASSEESPD
jgi:hypothetical protein